jgi:type IV pilus assembly protein PilM
MSESQNIRDKINDFIAETFKIGPNNTIGIDIGSHSIKVAEVFVSKKNVVKINKFIHKKIPDGCILEDEIVKPEELTNIIKDCFKELSLSNLNVSIALFGPNTMSKRIQVSTGTRKQIEDQVIWESEQYIPFGIEDSTVNFHVIGENEGGGTDVYVAAAANKIIEIYLKIIADANAKVKIIDLNHFAFCNAFSVIYANEIKNITESILLIDFGHQNTNLMIYKNKSMLFNREITMGGIHVTEEIQRHLNLSTQEAEDLKCGTNSEGKVPEEILAPIQESIEALVTEIKKTINFYMTASSEETLSQCFISGGSSLLPGLDKILERELSIGVELIDIMKFVETGKTLTEDMFPYINSCGLTAIGLGMRKIFK